MSQAVEAPQCLAIWICDSERTLFMLSRLHGALTVGLLMLGMTSAASMTLLASGPGFVLGAEPVRITLRSQAGEAPLARRLRALGTERQIYLVLQNLEGGAPPGITYNVYLGLASNTARTGTNDPSYVGSFNFFGAHPGRNISFNVTGRLRQISLGADELGIAIVPIGAPKGGSQPKVSRVDLLAQ
jgi:hypothetical protein